MEKIKDFIKIHKENMLNKKKSNNHALNFNKEDTHTLEDKIIIS